MKLKVYFSFHFWKIHIKNIYQINIQIQILLIFIIIQIILHYKDHNYLLLMLDSYGLYLLYFYLYYLWYIFYAKIGDELEN